MTEADCLANIFMSAANGRFCCILISGDFFTYKKKLNIKCKFILRKGNVMKEIGLKDKLKGEKLSSPKTLTGVAMLVALYTILSFFTINLTINLGTTWEIGFADLALAVCGMLYGPIPCAVAGAAGDLLGFIVSPNGRFFPGFTLSAFITGMIYGLLLYNRPVSLKRAALAEGIIIVICNLILTRFFPGFTLSAFITGMIYGLLLYNRPVSLKRAALAEGIIIVICNLILTPLWLNMLYGTNLIAIPRIIRNIIMFPINTALAYSVLKGVRGFRKNVA